MFAIPQLSPMYVSPHLIGKYSVNVSTSINPGKDELTWIQSPNSENKGHLVRQTSQQESMGEKFDFIDKRSLSDKVSKMFFTKFKHSEEILYFFLFFFFGWNCHFWPNWNS